MNKYIVLSNNIVEEIIDVDESKLVNMIYSAKEILSGFFPDKTILKYSQDQGNVCIGSIFINNDCFFQPKPYPSWVWEGNNWTAPVPYPKNNNVNFWNEEEKKWEIYEGESVEK